MTERRAACGRLARIALLAALLAGGPACTGAMLAAGDGGDASDLASPDASPSDLVPGPDLLAPPRPLLGDSIDRMGRPLVTAMLTDFLDLDGKRDAVDDAYNRDVAAARWASRYQSGIAASLALIDVLDGACGNQPLYDASSIVNKNTSAFQAASSR